MRTCAVTCGINAIYLSVLISSTNISTPTVVTVDIIVMTIMSTIRLLIPTVNYVTPTVMTIELSTYLRKRIVMTITLPTHIFIPIVKTIYVPVLTVGIKTYLEALPTHYEVTKTRVVTLIMRVNETTTCFVEL